MAMPLMAQSYNPPHLPSVTPEQFTMQKLMMFVAAVCVATTTFPLPLSSAADWNAILVPPPEDKASWDPNRFAPSPRQLTYQEGQLGAFLHFGLATFATNDAEYEAALHPRNKPAIADRKRFNPTQLDAEQWVLAAKAMGAKHFVFTTKHHDGFCLWPTKTTEHCVRNTPWKNGQGDVVREVADACRKQGMPFGIYCSPADMYQGCWANAADKCTLIGDRDAYLRTYLEQLRELLTGYGEIVVVWLDVYCDPFSELVVDKSGKRIDSRPYEDAVVALIRRLQPKAVILHWGTDRTDVKAVGNEDGTAPYPVWNIARKGSPSNVPELAPESEGWYLHECDIPTRPKWHWRPNSDDQLATVDRLMHAYDHSIGVGSNILINLTPDVHGRIPDAEVKRVTEFGETVRKQFANPIVKTDSSRGWAEPGILEVDLARPRMGLRVVLEEDVAFGQHVLEYAVDAEINGRWKPVAQGTSLGRKRIHRLDPATEAQKLRLRIVKADAVPVIRSFAVSTDDVGSTRKASLVKQAEVFAKEVVESTPVLYRGRRILVACHRPFCPSHAALYDKMYLFLRDEQTGEVLSRFGEHHSLGSGFVEGDTLHVFAAEGPKTDWFQNIYHFWTNDLKTWKRELAVLRSGNEHLLNTSVCRDEQGYLMAYESDNPVGCCFKFARSKDLRTWQKLDGLTFAGPNGNAYSACPVIRYFKPYYYAIYLHTAIPGHNGWVSFLARSKDLITWELSPQNPILEATPAEGSNNSDVDLIEDAGKTYVYYCTGDQATWGELRRAVYPGSMKDFFESYFPKDAVGRLSIVRTGVLADNTAAIPVPKLENDSYDWYARHDAILKMKDKIKPEIVLIGDSITHFWAGEPKAGRQTGLKSWQRLFENRPVLNLGFGSDRTQNVLWRLEHGEFEGLKPRLVVLNIGTNNLAATPNARANTPAEVAKAIGVICDQLKYQSPDSKIVLMGVFPRGQKADDPFREKIVALNRLLAEFPRSHGVEFVDIGRQFLAPDGTIPTDLMFDGCHPSENGYALWAESLRRFVVASPLQKQ
jgi:alpha-L-fucosidase/lysophospholipase L1-like esterase